MINPKLGLSNKISFLLHRSDKGISFFDCFLHLCDQAGCIAFDISEFIAKGTNRLGIEVVLEYQHLVLERRQHWWHCPLGTTHGRHQLAITGFGITQQSGAFTAQAIA